MKFGREAPNRCSQLFGMYRVAADARPRLNVVGRLVFLIGATAYNK